MANKVSEYYEYVGGWEAIGGIGSVARSGLITGDERVRRSLMTRPAGRVLSSGCRHAVEGVFSARRGI